MGCLLLGWMHRTPVCVAMPAITDIARQALAWLFRAALYPDRLSEEMTPHDSRAGPLPLTRVGAGHARHAAIL